MSSAKKPNSYLCTKTKTFVPSELKKGAIVAGRYKLIRELGRGGMGVVYEMEDQKLKRTVALKAINPQLLSDKESRARFLREARSAAALNHSNLCTIHEIHESDKNSFIVMEFVDGQDLKEIIKRKSLEHKKSLDIAIQIGKGLSHAHQKGIVHRDIKSSNIMVNKKGQTKIMDFGLAKLMGSTNVTQKGSTLGTIAYMSPEQAKGKEVDFRSDIWSVGVVLYEMVSGALPFRGDRDQAVIYSILNEDPLPFDSQHTRIPGEYKRIIKKCLEKDPVYRYQSAADLLSDLRKLKRDWEKERQAPVEISVPCPPPPSRLIKPLIIALPIIAVLLVAAGLYMLVKPKKNITQIFSELSLSSLTSGEHLAVSPSWSPDGTWIVYASDEAGSLDIWKKPIEGGEAERITSSPYHENYPSWSPDGRYIAFSLDIEDGGIFLIPSDGGSALKLTNFGTHPSWSPNGEALAFDWYGNIYSMVYPGGEPQLLVSGTSSTPYTVWTPDGEKIVFWNRTKGDIYVYYLKEKKERPLKLVPSGQEVAGLSFSPNGKRLMISLGPFGGNKNLYRVRFDPASGKAEGNLESFSMTTTEDIHCAFSPDGTRLAFLASQQERHLWAYPLDPSTGIISGQPIRLTHKNRHNYYPDCSPDGSTIVWTSHLSGQGVLCVTNIDGGEEKKATTEWGNGIREVGGSFSPDGLQISYSTTLRDSYEVWLLSSIQGVSIPLTRTQYPSRDTLTDWSPDGSTIAFYSNRMNNWDIWSIQSGGKGHPRQITKWVSNELYPSWSPDGQSIAFRTDKEGNADIWLIDSDGKNPRPYVTHPAEEGWSAWSPDGRWFYFISNRSGAFQVWIMPASGGEPRQVTQFEGISKLPEFVLYTKFSVSSEYIILPLETQRGNLFLFENIE